MERKIRVALLMGSDREGRFCDVVARWAIDQINRRSEFTLDVIDPLEVALPTRIERQPSAEVQAYRERIGRADAFVLIVPEYNHGYPAALKSMIDHAKEEWYAKPIAMVSYGGMAGGLPARRSNRARPSSAPVFPTRSRRLVRALYPPHSRHRWRLPALRERLRPPRAQECGTQANPPGS